MSGYVYFVFDGGFVRVGYSRTVEDAWTVIESESPAKKPASYDPTGHPTLLRLVPGTRADEKRIRAALSEWRVSGDWYMDTPQTLARIAFETQAAVS